MAIPKGIIFGWPDTAASIPAGWSRVAALDGRYLRGSAIAGGTGGSATHKHGVDAHTHTQNSHGHDLTVSVEDGTRNVHQFVTGGLTVALAEDHTHGGNSSSIQATNNNAAAQDTSDADNIPSFLDVVWVESGGGQHFPVGALGWWFDSEIPDHWKKAGAANGRLLCGAAPDGDGGGTGGSDTHDHTLPAHTHTSPSHRHYIPELDDVTLDPAKYIAVVAPSLTVARRIHSHSCAVWGGWATITNQNAVPTIDEEESWPPYVKVGVVTRESGGIGCPVGLIGAWRGGAGSIPAGWHICDGTDGTPDLVEKFALATNVAGDYGDAGGAGAHDHTSPAHTHIQNSHGHSGLQSSIALESYSAYATGGDPRLICLTDEHRHDFSLAVTTATNQGTALDVSETNTLPLYSNVIFVQYQGCPGGATDLLRVRAADVWQVVAPRPAQSQSHPFTLLDICGGYERRAHEVSADGTWGDLRLSLNRWNQSLIMATIADAPGSVYVALAREAGTTAFRLVDKEAASIGASFTQAALEVMPANALLIALLLKNTGRWYQSSGEWDRVEEAFAFVAPIECDTDPGGSFPDAADVAGCLRRTAAGGLLFSMVDDTWTARLLRCDAVPEDASGSWQEVASIGPAYLQATFDIMPASSMLTMLLLKDDGRWQQTCGEWNEAAGRFDLVDPPVECDTAPPGGFPNGADAEGALRRLPSGGLLFATADADGEGHLFRCLSMPQDATGTWEET